VVREVERATEKRVVVVPLRIEDSQPTADMEYFLSSRHWLDAFDGSFSDHVTNMVAAVKALLASAALEQLNRDAEGDLGVGPSLRELSRSASELFDGAKSSVRAGRPAIAVLPFVTLSNDPDQEYFANGISEELITRLAAWRDFPVIARNSSFAYTAKADAKSIGRDLGARYLVEGSVRKGNDRVRISVQLIDTETGGNVWAERFDRKMIDIFDLQDEISEAIVVSMHPELSRFEQERAVHKPSNLDAWDCKLQGDWYFYAGRDTQEGNAKAREFFARAIELDPNFASAYAALAMSHFYSLVNQQTDSPVEAVKQLFEAAQKCIALDGKNPEGHIALAVFYGLVGQRDQIFRSLELAIELNPCQPQAHFQLGNFLAYLGRADEAIESLERAMTLSPRDRFMWEFLGGTAMAHFGAARYEEAVDWALRSLHRRPDSLYPQGILAASYAWLDRMDEAQQVGADIARMHEGFTVSGFEPLLVAADPGVVERLVKGLRDANVPE
jgi:adenylate cyclase